jgi:hypothetical protein
MRPVPGAAILEGVAAVRPSDWASGGLVALSPDAFARFNVAGACARATGCSGSE